MNHPPYQLKITVDSNYCADFILNLILQKISRWGWEGRIEGKVVVASLSQRVRT